MPFILVELSNILLAIRPSEISEAVHLIVQPLSNVQFLIRPHIPPFALNFIHIEFSYVH